MSYRSGNYLMSPGLKRARQPYRLRNAATGIALAAFGIAVWAYSISAVKQDVFDDVDDRARELAANKSEPVLTTAIPTTIPTTTTTTTTTPTTVVAAPSRGMLVKLLDARCPGLFDPTRKTLVWGAPSVDNVGSMSDTH